MSQLRTIAKCAIKAHRYARGLREALPQVDEDLCGACAIASAYLLKLLVREGIEATFNLGDGHAFVTVGDYYIDVTGEQFGAEPIYIGIGPPYDSPQWYPDYATERVDMVPDLLDHNGWIWDANQVYHRVLAREAA